MNKKKEQANKRGFRTFRVHKKFLLFGAAAGIMVLAILAHIAIRGASISNKVGMSPSEVVGLLFDTGTTLRSSEGLTNVLILGKAGGQHAGSDLTDTILMASISPQNISLISTPRDIWSENLKDKINSAYHYGQERDGQGKRLAKTVIEETLGLPVHYVIVIDFEGFEKLIDLVGGVDIDVPLSFVDTQFPIAGKENDLCDGDPEYACRYETIEFEKGIQHMSGEQALKYVRSRHAAGEEGTDFARGKRQQQVLLAIKNKLVRPDIWFAGINIEKMIDIFFDTTDTDMTIRELASIGKRVYSLRDEGLKRVSIESLYQVAPPEQYDGRYVLVPSESIQSVYEFLRDELLGEAQ